MTITEWVFKIGPRLNACGRMKSRRAAVELLLTDDPVFARQQAEEVNQHNEDRRDCDSETTREALELLQADPDYPNRRSTVVYAPHWHKGVLGIVASRLMVLMCMQLSIRAMICSPILVVISTLRV